MDESKELNPAANSHGYRRPLRISIDELDKLNAASVVKNVNSVATVRQKNPKASLEQMPFIRLSRRLLPGIGKELAGGRTLTICDALVLAYIHTSQLAGHSCGASRSYMAVDLGMNRSRVSSSLSALSDAGLVKLGNSCVLVEDVLARFVGFSGPKEASRSWLGDGEFLRIPLWLLARKKTKPTEAFVFGDEMSLSLLNKKNKPVPAETKAAALGMSGRSLIRARASLVDMGLLEEKPGIKRKKPVEYFIPGTALEIAQQLEAERIEVLRGMAEKKTKKAKKDK